MLEGRLRGYRDVDVILDRTSPRSVDCRPLLAWLRPGYEEVCKSSWHGHWLATAPLTSLMTLDLRRTAGNVQERPCQRPHWHQLE